jgi:hypothetical protein
MPYGFPWQSTPFALALHLCRAVSAQTRWRRATRFDTMIIVMILVPGLGVIGPSQCSAHA